MLRYRARMGRELCVTYNKIGNFDFFYLILFGQRNGRPATWVDLAGIDPRDQTQGI